MTAAIKIAAATAKVTFIPNSFIPPTCAARGSPQQRRRSRRYQLLVLSYFSLTGRKRAELSTRTCPIFYFSFALCAQQLFIRICELRHERLHRRRAADAQFRRFRQRFGHAVCIVRSVRKADIPFFLDDRLRVAALQICEEVARRSFSSYLLCV